ncbi:MAG: ABC transporter permease subunit [Xanthobacteraceae bacterium]
MPASIGRARASRRSSLRSPEPIGHAPITPLLGKEFSEILAGRALWTMLLIACPLIGYSFFQAVSLYGEASETAGQSPALAGGLAPLDGILVPTFGAFYVAITLLFPFVAVRVLAHEKETGALRLLVQLPYGPATLIAAKLAAITLAWGLASVPAVSALAVWAASGGHLYAPETLNLLLGHLLYGSLVGAVALFAASISDSSATAAIVALAATIGSWVLDFTVAGRSGLADWLSRLSLTQTLRPFEQGLLSIALVIGIFAAISMFAALATVWLPPGVPIRAKLVRSIICLAAAVGIFAAASQVGLSFDVTEDRRNSLSLADERALANLKEPLRVTADFAPEDPRYVDLRRNVLAKLKRAMPRVEVRLVGSRQAFASGAGDESYGEVRYAYGNRSDVSRSTSPREILPLLYALAGVPRPEPVPGADYPGYPLVADTSPALFWFLGVLPMLIAATWWRSRRPPSEHELTHLKEVER